ncbi:MAG: hypothetical protein V4572_01765 [Bacteroidota bacterium]
MEKQIDPNYIKASNIFFIITFLGLIPLFLPSNNIFINNYTIPLGISYFTGKIAIAFLVRQGYNWVKILILIIVLLGIIGVPTILKNLREQPIVGALDVTIAILHVWALILLFKADD